MEKISAVYKITNTITGDFYVGSSKDVKRRWRSHKCQSTWKKCPSNPMYLDMQKYGIDKFVFEIIAEAEQEQLKETEQQFIEKLKHTYNNYNHHLSNYTLQAYQTVLHVYEVLWQDYLNTRHLHLNFLQGLKMLLL